MNHMKTLGLCFGLAALVATATIALGLQSRPTIPGDPAKCPAIQKDPHLVQERSFADVMHEHAQDVHLVRIVARKAPPPTLTLQLSCGTNPYRVDGDYGNHPAPPLPECAEGKHLDTTCKDACTDTWRYDLDNALINAFCLWNNACDTWRACRAACGGDLNCKNACDSAWQGAQISIFQQFTGWNNDADTTYINCVLGCCVPD